MPRSHVNTPWGDQKIAKKSNTPGRTQTRGASKEKEEEITPGTFSKFLCIPGGGCFGVQAFSWTGAFSKDSAVLASSAPLQEYLEYRRLERAEISKYVSSNSFDSRR